MRSRGSRTFQLLAHSLQMPAIVGWARLKSGAGSSIRIFHLGDRAQVLELPAAASQGVCYPKLESDAELALKPRQSSRNRLFFFPCHTSPMLSLCLAPLELEERCGSPWSLALAPVSCRCPNVDPRVSVLRFPRGSSTHWVAHISSSPKV